LKLVQSKLAPGIEGNSHLTDLGVETLLDGFLLYQSDFYKLDKSVESFLELNSSFSYVDMVETI
jgi:hypothetical protein